MNGHLFFPIALAVAGGVLYHVSQKAVPKAVNPFAAVILAYLVGIGLSFAALLLNPARSSLATSFKGANWAVVGIGAGALIIEVGFLLAYRAGWNISSASVICNISVALLLIPVGLIAFKEHLSVRSLAGILCCLVGLYLISKK